MNTLGDKKYQYVFLKTYNITIGEIKKTLLQ